MGQRFQQRHNRLGARPRRRQRKAKQNRNEHHLQNVALGKRIRHRGRNDVHQEFGDALRFGLSGIISDGFRIERGRIHIEAAAGMNDVAHDQADEQRNGRNNFKIEQSLAADAPHFFQILHARDAGHHGAEDENGDDHGDHADEGVAQRLHGDGSRGAHIPQDQRERHGDQHLHPQATRRTACGEGWRRVRRRILGLP